MVRVSRVLIPTLLLVLACARSGGEAAPTSGSGRVELEVTNGNALPMQVYASGSGITHRVGTVHPGMEAHFVIPQNLVGSGAVQFEARPSGGGQPFRSGEILLAPGTLIQFEIAAQLFNSTVTRR